MTLRSRMAVLVALAVALAVGGVSWAAYGSATTEARGEIDEFLSRRGPLGARAVILEGVLPGPRGGEGRGFEVGREDLLAQGVSSDGTIVPFAEEDPELPVSPDDLEVAAGLAPEILRDVTIGDTNYRMITRQVGDGFAVQVARDLTETEEILSDLRLRLLGVGGLGVLLATLLGWLVAKGAMRPVEEITTAAEHVAATRDLESTIVVRRRDEVGRLAGAFNEMMRALAEAGEQQRRLIGDASHELRTPLTSLRTNIELLERAVDLEPEERSAILADATAELVELSALVAELVDLATVGGSDEPQVEVEVEDLVADLVALSRRRTGRQILMTGAGGRAQVRESEVRRAVGNLIDNAVKWSPPAEPIDVVVDQGRVTVADRGPGFDPADLPRVFDRFYRSTAARSLSGSGLGLAIVKRVAEVHGGGVFAQNRPGGGAEVGFFVPTVAE